MVDVEYRSPHGGSHIQRLGSLAPNDDSLLVVLDRSRSIRSAIGVRPLSGFEKDEVTPVPAGVGEAPGDVTVAAGHEEGGPGERHADDTARRATVLEDQGRAIPGVGKAEAEVHVVGHQRAAVFRATRGHGPVVAAGNRCEGVGPRGGLLQGCRFGILAQVHDVGPGQRRSRQRPTNERCVPLRSPRKEEVGERSREGIPDEACRRLGGRLAPLHVEEDGEEDENRVLGLPWLRRRPEDDVLQGAGSEVLEASVDANSVCADEIALTLGRLTQGGFGDSTEPVDADLTVRIHHAGPEELS